MKEVIKTTLATIVIIIGAIFMVYGFFGLLDWVFSDPFNWISEHRTMVTSEYDSCVYQAGTFFKKQNPATEEVTKFIDYCLEKN